MYIERLLSEFNSSQYSISKKMSMTWVISPQVTLSRISSIAKNISVFSYFFAADCSHQYIIQYLDHQPILWTTNDPD